MSFPTSTLWEVFVPQCHYAVSLRRTDRQMIMTTTDRRKGTTRTHRYTRPGAQFSPKGVDADFRNAMDLKGYKPL